LKCLLDLRSILLDQDCRYVLNDLYITDYCVWIQTASDKRLHSLADAIEKVLIVHCTWLLVINYGGPIIIC